MKELFDRKPEWDRRATSLWQLFNEGKVPMFGAAHLLHRSLIDFTLLQALTNLPESDTRRRGIVYAFSGARPAAISLPGVTTVDLDLTAIFTLALLGLLPVAIGAYEQVAIPHSTLGSVVPGRPGETRLEALARRLDGQYCLSGQLLLEDVGDGYFAHRPLASRFVDDIRARYPGRCGAFLVDGSARGGADRRRSG